MDWCLPKANDEGGSEYKREKQWSFEVKEISCVVIVTQECWTVLFCTA